MAVTSKTLVKDSAYTSLLNQVRKTLVEGQARIEQERVRTYWETGRVIQADILKNKDRAAYGAEVMNRLAQDLKVGKRTLDRCVQFAKTYPQFPIVSGRTQFSWMHYRELMSIPDQKKRGFIEKIASQNSWSAEELALRIKDEKEDSGETGLKPVSTRESVPAKPSLNNKPLVPLRGELYTYRILKRKVLAPSASSDLVIDLGFSVIYEPSRRDGFQTRLYNQDQIIESRPKENAYTFSKTNRTAKDLFTYAAYVERVIDGDTLKVYVDLGFNTWTHQTLRLRDLDCPELGTKSGDEAKTFVQSFLKESQMIIIRSSKSDKYDRYLADVFIPKSEDLNPETDVYLNNLLLESGRAVRM